MSVTDAPKDAWPYYSQDEVEAVTNVLRSGKVNYWSSTECQQFEQEFAAFMGSDYAICMANGTLTLETALIACGIKPGDEVITSPRTFIASASAIVAVGAVPVFADVDLRSQNITAQSIEKVISAKTKAIIPVHLAGWPCDMPGIMTLAKTHRLYVIEDCAQAHGAEINGKKVGTWGHFGSFSFCQDKIMSTGGEGGMLVCNDKLLYKKAWGYKDHGKDYDSVFNKQHPVGFRWLHSFFGTNARMTAMQAAIGRIQLKKLPEWLHVRNQNAKKYIDVLKDIPCVEIPMPEDNIYHAYYKFYILLKLDCLKKGHSRESIYQRIVEQNVFCNMGSCSQVYREKAFDHQGLPPYQLLANAKSLGERSLMFLVHPTLSADQIHKNAHIVKSVLLEANI